MTLGTQVMHPKKINVFLLLFFEKYLLEAFILIFKNCVNQEASKAPLVERRNGAGREKGGINEEGQKIK